MTQECPVRRFTQRPRARLTMPDASPPRAPGNPLAELAILAIVGIALGLAGVFGTRDMPLVLRMVYWVSGFWAAWLALRLLLFLTRPAAQLLQLPPSTSYLLAVPLLALLIVIGIALSRGDLWAASPILFAQIAGLSIALYALFWWLYQRQSPASGDPKKASEDGLASGHPAGIATSALHDRLPPGFGPIWALTSADHYVTVIGEGRSELILMSLQAAIEEAGADKGTRLHRSWWAANQAVSHVRREGRKAVAILKDGQALPISRSHLARVEAAFRERH